MAEQNAQHINVEGIPPLKLYNDVDAFSDIVIIRQRKNIIILNDLAGAELISAICNLSRIKKAS